MAVAAGALTLGLGACGGTTSIATPEAELAPARSALSGMSPAAVIAKTSKSDETPQNARFTLTTTSPGAPTTKATGAYQRGTENAMSMIIDMSAAGAAAGLPLAGRLETLITGGTMYFRLLGADAPLGDSWTKVSFDDLATMGGMNLSWMTDLISHADPQSGVDLLLEAEDLVDLGDEVIDGVRTRHYRGTIDAPAIINQLATDATSRKQLRKTFRELGVTGAVQEMWVDDDFNIRRSVNRQQANIGEFLTTMTFSGFDEELTISAPDGADVLDLADLAPVRAPISR